jgi:hypothetical protein
MRALRDIDNWMQRILNKLLGLASKACTPKIPKNFYVITLLSVETIGEIPPRRLFVR